jgi:hypothetical protein
MSTAAVLREALDLGRRHSPELLLGDPVDPSEGNDPATTPAAVLVAVVDRPSPG